MELRARDGQTIAVTSIRIERPTLDALKVIAKAERRSVGQQIRLELERAVKRHDELLDRFSDEGDLDS